jgi:hypothetical protein
MLVECPFFSNFFFQKIYRKFSIFRKNFDKFDKFDKNEKKNYCFGFYIGVRI